MTARPIPAERYRRPASAAVALALVICIFIAIPGIGATTNYPADDGTIHFSNGSSWIRWDPVSDHVAGDQFFVNGSTNISAGSLVQYEFYTPVDCHVKYCDSSDSIRDGNVTIGPGEIPGINRFSVRINATGLKNTTGPGSEQYFLSFRVFSSENSPESEDFPGFENFITRRSSLFSDSIRDSIESEGLSQSGEPGRYYWIALDYDTVSFVHDYSIPCDQITGMTNLPAGENLYYSAFSYDDYREIDRHVSNRTLGGSVVPGKIQGVNSFVIPLNTSGFSEIRYLVIWNPRYNASDRADSISTTVIFARPVSNNSETCPPRNTLIKIYQPNENEQVILGDIAQPEYFIPVQGKIVSQEKIRSVRISNGMEETSCNITTDGKNIFSCTLTVHRNTSAFTLTVTDSQGNRAEKTRNFTPRFGLPPPGIIFVSGVVVDNHGNPVPDAELTFENNTGDYQFIQNTLSDDDGNYSIRAQFGFNQKITVRKAGFQTITQERSFSSYHRDVNFTLYPQENQKSGLEIFYPVFAIMMIFFIYRRACS